VVHSLKIIAMRVCQDAIPGLRVPVWFTPTKIGRYQDQLRPALRQRPFRDVRRFLTVESPADFDKWLKSKSGATTSVE
jgi:cytochrome c oxidase subunit 2